VHVAELHLAGLHGRHGQAGSTAADMYSRRPGMKHDYLDHSRTLRFGQ
jgi:hypothetical protein